MLCKHERLHRLFRDCAALARSTRAYVRRLGSSSSDFCTSFFLSSLLFLFLLLGARRSQRQRVKLYINLDFTKECRATTGASSSSRKPKIQSSILYIISFFFWLKKTTIKSMTSLYMYIYCIIFL